MILRSVPPLLWYHIDIFCLAPHQCLLLRALSDWDHRPRHNVHQQGLPPAQQEERRDGGKQPNIHNDDILERLRSS